MKCDLEPPGPAATDREQSGKEQVQPKSWNPQACVVELGMNPRFSSPKMHPVPDAQAWIVLSTHSSSFWAVLSPCSPLSPGADWASWIFSIPSSNTVPDSSFGIHLLVAGACTHAFVHPFFSPLLASASPGAASHVCSFLRAVNPFHARNSGLAMADGHVPAQCSPHCSSVLGLLWRKRSPCPEWVLCFRQHQTFGVGLFLALPCSCCVFDTRADWHQRDAKARAEDGEKVVEGLCEMWERHEGRMAWDKAEGHWGQEHLWNICVCTRCWEPDRLFVIPKTNKEGWGKN